MQDRSQADISKRQSMGLHSCSLSFCALFACLQTDARGSVDVERRLNGIESADVLDLTEEKLRKLHRQIDANNDGQVSSSEILGFSARTRHAIAEKSMIALSNELESLKDGSLSLAEHLSDTRRHHEDVSYAELEMRRGMETAKFQAADANVDGTLDRDEMLGLFYPETNSHVLSVEVAQLMREKDKNGDDKITLDELWELDRPNGDVSEASDSERAAFEILDANNDGAVDFAEMWLSESGQHRTNSTIKTMFTLSDTNDDLSITSDEFANARSGFAGSDVQMQLIEWALHSDL